MSYEAIDSVVSAMRSMYDEQEELSATMQLSYPFKIRQMRMVDLTVPRRFGKTMYIRRNYTEHDLVLVPSYDMLKHTYEIKHLSKIVWPVQSFIAAMKRGTVARPLPTHTLYVDEPEWCCRAANYKTRDAFLTYLLDNIECKELIMLGSV